MRRCRCFPVTGKNALQYWPCHVSPWRVVWHGLVIGLCGILPSFRVKNWLYRRIGVKVGQDASIGVLAKIDVLFPHQISIGNNVIIGYNTVLLGHEYLRDEWRLGPVVIEDDAVVGANCTILPGVTIGRGAVVAAMSLVNRDIPPHTFCGGVPVRPLRAKRSGQRRGRPEHVI